MFTAWYFKDIHKFHSKPKANEKVFCSTLVLGYKHKPSVLCLNQAKNIL